MEETKLPTNTCTMKSCHETSEEVAKIERHRLQEHQNQSSNDQGQEKILPDSNSATLKLDSRKFRDASKLSKFRSSAKMNSKNYSTSKRAPCHHLAIYSTSNKPSTTKLLDFPGTRIQHRNPHRFNPNQIRRSNQTGSSHNT